MDRSQLGAEVSKTDNNPEQLPLQFIRGVPVRSRGEKIEDFLKQLTTSHEDTKTVIAEIVAYHTESTNNPTVFREVTFFIIELFSSVIIKKNLKKYLQDLITEHHLTNEIIKEAVDHIFKKATDEKICDMKECREFLNFIAILQTSPTYAYMENFMLLIPLYAVLYQGFLRQSRSLESVCPDGGVMDLFDILNQILKQLLPIFTNNSVVHEVKEKYIPNMMISSYIVLHNANTPFELRLIVCLFFLNSYQMVHGVEPGIAQLVIGEKFSIPIDQLEMTDAPKDYHIVLYCSIIDALPEKQLINERIDEKPIICVLFERILENAERFMISNAQNAKVLVTVSRILSEVTKLLRGVALDLIPPLLRGGFRYVSLHADHDVDAVKSSTKLFLFKLVGLGAYYFYQGTTELTTIIMNLINDIPDQCNMNFWIYEVIAKYYGAEFLLQKFDELPTRLLKLFLENRNLRSQIESTYKLLLEECYTIGSKEAELEWAETWVAPAGAVIKAAIGDRIGELFGVSILHSAFKLQPAVLRMIYPNDFIGTEGDGKLLLTCLREARKMGIDLPYLQKDSKLYWRGLIDKQKMEMYMIHQSSQIRLLVLGSVANSLRSTELFLDWELIYLINYIKFNITVECPSDRKAIIGYYKKILIRFDAGTKVIQRNITTAISYSTLRGENCVPKSRKASPLLVFYTELEKKYKRFLENLMKFLIGNLSSDSNFPRRNASLELLLIICEIIPRQEWINYWTADDVKNSHNILFDTYECNKRMIVRLFKTLPPDYLGFMNTGFTFSYMQRCIGLSLDVKPSKTLSAAYLLELCCCSPHFYEIVGGDHTDNNEVHEPTLEMIDVLTKKFLIESTTINVENIGLTKTAVYGLILSIRHLLENSDIQQHHQRYAEVFNDLAPACINISEKLLPIVCNPSPEGYLPDNVDNVDDIGVHDDTPKAQIVLVYAWRTIKEITLLLAELLKESVKLECSQITLLPTESLIEIAQLFINIFLQSKHRGVFEQAYVGFSVVCESFGKSTNPEMTNLPKKWLRDAVDLCIGKKHSDDLCSTRRSAGLPFLILSVLTTDGDPSNFRNTIDDLLKSAEHSDKSSDETRMHCLNVLRAIFRDSKMSERALPYVAAGVIIAISGFNSPIWGIRNSSTLLFAALMTRMFGVQRSSDSDNMSIKNKLTVQVFFMRYQQLYKFMLNTLAEECTKKSSLVLQPILLILSRLYPSSFEDRPETVSDLLPHIEVCLKNPEYRIKEAAANASVALINIKDVKTYFDKCFDKIADRKIAENECHGILLQMRSILNKMKVTDLPLSHYLQQSCYIWESEERRFSHMTINLYTELVTAFLYQLNEFDDVYWLKQILLYLSKIIMKNSHPLTSQCNYGRSRILLAFFIIINKVEKTNSTYSTITNEIMSLLHAPQSRLKQTCLHFLICLNQFYDYNNEMDMSLIDYPWIRTSYLKQGEEHEPDLEGHPLFRMGYLQIDSEIRKLVHTFRYSSIKQILVHSHLFVTSFLTSELNMPYYICGDDRVLLFLLAAYYPCAIKKMKLDRQVILNTLISFCNCDNEEIISAVISCISSYLCIVDYSILRYDYDELLVVLANSASPAAAVHRRLSVCDFLCNNYFLYCNGATILKGDQLCTVLNIIMVLLEDDNVNIREGMSKFENNIRVRIKISESLHDSIPGHEWPVIPEKAKEDLVNLITVVLPQEQAVCQIFSWACRYFPDYYAESCEIFERGGVNQFAENTPLVELCSKVLVKILWELPDGLSYDDKSIFIEEQTLIVTQTLLNSLLRYNSPMMLPKTKLIILCALRMLFDYMDEREIGKNFVDSFRKYFNETILSYLTQALQLGDHFCVTKLFKQLYSPVFRQLR